MSASFINRRESTRMSVRDIGYHATFDVDGEFVEANVSDFSATGLCVEFPAHISIPVKGALEFRGQYFAYKVRRDVVEGETRRYGLATTGICRATLSAASATANAHSRYQAKVGRARLRRAASSFTVWAIVTAGTCAACAFVYGHGTRALDIQFQMQTDQVSRTLIESANARARELNRFAQTLSKNRNMSSIPAVESSLTSIWQSDVTPSNTSATSPSKRGALNSDDSDSSFFESN